MSELYRRGLKEITSIDPENGAGFIEEVRKASPDLSEYFVEFGFGEIYSREVLDSKTKALIAISSLVGIGHCQSHLKILILGALRAECSKEEIIETIIQSIPHVGFPSTLLAMKTAAEAFRSNPTISKPKRRT